MRTVGPAEAIRRRSSTHSLARSLTYSLAYSHISEDRLVRSSSARQSWRYTICSCKQMDVGTEPTPWWRFGKGGLGAVGESERTAAAVHFDAVSVSTRYLSARAHPLRDLTRSKRASQPSVAHASSFQSAGQSVSSISGLADQRSSSQV